MLHAQYIPTVTLVDPVAPPLASTNELDIELTVAVQVYSPELLVSTELIVAVLV